MFCGSTCRYAWRAPAWLACSSKYFSTAAPQPWRRRCWRGNDIEQPDQLGIECRQPCRDTFAAGVAHQQRQVFQRRRLQARRVFGRGRIVVATQAPCFLCEPPGGCPFEHQPGRRFRRQRHDGRRHDAGTVERDEPALMQLCIQGKSGPMEVNRTISGTPWPAYHRVQYASRSSSGRVDNPSTLTQRALWPRRRPTHQPSFVEHLLANRGGIERRLFQARQLPSRCGSGWAAGTASTAGIEVQSSSLTRSIISAPNAI